MDASRYTPNRVDFGAFPQATMAKIVLAVLLGLAALTVLSLLAIWLRVRSRGGLGGKTGAAIRSAYAIVLGVGGWFGGVLVALTALPTVPLDSELLACISIGVPVGLAVFLASTGWSRAGLPRTTAFIAALAGALAGAWLGFNSVSGLFAVLTTAIGATAASNLAVLLIDIAWQRQAAPARTPVPTPEPQGGRQMHSPLPHSNLAARMGRWSAAHWKTATFGWLGFVVVAFALSSVAGIKNPDPNAHGPGQSGRMDKILDDGFKQPAGESVLIQSRSLRTSDPAFAAAIKDVIARVSTLAVVQNVHRGEVAKNGHAALVDFSIRGEKSRRPTRSARSSTASPRCRRPTRRCSSASSAMQAPSRAPAPPSATTWRRPEPSRCRSRLRSCCLPSERLSPQASPCCSGSLPSSRRSGCSRFPATCSRSPKRRRH